MGTNLLLTLMRRGGEAEIRAFAPEQDLSPADARDLVGYAVEATHLLRYTWGYPRRALGEAGLEAGAFREVCREALAVLDNHQALLGLVRRRALWGLRTLGAYRRGFSFSQCQFFR